MGWSRPLKLDGERHAHASDVPPAVDGMSASEREQRVDRVILVIDERTDLVLPGRVDPPHDGEGEIFLAREEVVQGASRVPGIARHALEGQVAVAVARQPPSCRLQQHYPSARTALGLRRPRS
jgi:hypothetical protein